MSVASPGIKDELFSWAPPLEELSVRLSSSLKRKMALSDGERRAPLAKRDIV